MLTPLEIHNAEFKRVFRGYNEEEVDDFLQRLVKDYEKLYQDNIELRETIERLNNKLEHYQYIESTLHNTLVIAQETAEEVKLNAKKQTELITREAEIRSQKMLEEAKVKTRKLAAEYEEMQKQMQIYRGRMRSLLKSQLDLVDASQEEEG